MSENEHPETEQEVLEYVNDRMLGMNEADRHVRDVWKEYGEGMSHRSLIDLKHVVDGELQKRKGWQDGTDDLRERDANEQ